MVVPYNFALKASPIPCPGSCITKLCQCIQIQSEGEQVGIQTICLCEINSCKIKEQKFTTLKENSQAETNHHGGFSSLPQTVAEAQGNRLSLFQDAVLKETMKGRQIGNL